MKYKQKKNYGITLIALLINLQNCQEIKKKFEFIEEEYDPNQYLGDEGTTVTIDNNEIWYVKYGENDSFANKWVQNSVSFSNETFGDPCYGVIKKGYLVKKRWVKNID